MRQIIPINTDKDGCASCIKANYYKMGMTNFLRKNWGGKTDGFSATAVMEIYEQPTEKNDRLR